MFVSVFCCNEAYAEEYTDEERAAITEQADLIFEGTSVAVAQISDGATYHAVEEHRDLNWIVTFQVNKLLKGTFPEKTFSILVHSPALFFLLPLKDGIRKYKFYLKGSYETMYRLIGKEAIE